MQKQNICILVAAHKRADIPKNRLVVPIQVGTAAAGQRLAGMLHDDEGEHISGKNRMYCELTAQYYAWKNLEADYYGFFHYRRYMNFTKAYPVRLDGKYPAGRQTPYTEAGSAEQILAECALNERSIRAVVEKYDVITVLAEHMDVTVYKQFCQFHDKADLERMIAIVKKRRPQYAWACDAYMNAKYIYFCNMYIMKREYFFAYMQWLFPLLEEFEAEKDFSMCSGKQMRIIGYLAERLFGVYYTWLKEQKEADCCELQYMILHENKRYLRLWKQGPRIMIDMKKINRLMPAGSLPRRAVRTLMGRLLWENKK